MVELAPLCPVSREHFNALSDERGETLLGPQDPRLTWPPEREGWVLAYPAHRRREPVMSRALPREIREVRRLGPAIPSADKDAALSPRRFEVRWGKRQR